jgi:hypothetical protein
MMGNPLFLKPCSRKVFLPFIAERFPQFARRYRERYERAAFLKGDYPALIKERVARIRNRPVENRWIGQRISDPDIDCAALGKAQGAVGFDPVIHARDLVPTFEKAIAAVEDGQVAIVDVRVEPGYAAITTAAMLRGTEK